jgi:cardiolipin synthase
MKHIPNILSSLRIVLVGVFAWLFLTAFPDHMTRYWWAIGVYVLAFLTDVLDGFLARTFHWVTPVGKLLDPFADKLMVVTALVVILIEKARQGHMFGIYLALVILIAVKEILAMIGGFLMLRQGKVAYSDWSGKIATGLFGVGILLTLLSFLVPQIEPWNVAVLAAAVALAYVALAHYARTQMLRPRTNAPTDEEEKLIEKFGGHVK